MNDFHPTLHMACPQCDFEVVYLDYTKKKSYYVFQDGTIDYTTGSKEAIQEQEHGKIEFNHRQCNWYQRA